jgi:pyruvate dehydrogenase E2 component (dihydrolipoyllysine-residue acetyltransferase)
MPEIDVPMPKLSMTMTEGELIAWRVQEGEEVRSGDVIAEVMSDKVEMEVESPADGTLVRHAASEGDMVAVGAPIATLDSETEELLGDLFAPAPEAEAAAEPAPASPAQAQAPAPARAATGGKVRAVPAARRRARELGVDLAGVAGSGPDGLVRVGDVEAAASPAPAAVPAPPPAPAPAREPVPVTVSTDGHEEIPLTGMRKVVARRLVESMQSAPHFYLTVKVDAEPLLALRAQLNELLGPDGIKLSLNDLLVKACATALQMHPGINVSWAGDRILRHERIHIGIAVALEGGLIVPVIHDADRKSLRQISTEAKALIAKAREGRLSSEQISGGTFTISNLGMFGIDQFTAVINPPEAAILAVGATAREPVVVGDQVAIRSQMKLTLSIDHRPLDGATAAAFLQTLKGLIEAPLRITA